MMKNKQKKKGFFFRIIKSAISVKYKKRKIIGRENIPEEPSIIVGNHAQMHGPLAAEILFPYKRYTWCAGEVMNIKEAPSYTYVDFWAHKPKWSKWFYKILSYIISPLCVYIFKNGDTIPVYKDSRGILTFKHSVQAMKNGAHIIIFPEGRTEFNNIVNDFQDKFVDLARFYYKSTGKELLFVPMYNAPKLKTVVYGKPIKFDAKIPIDQHRVEICEYLKAEITKLAKDLPEHIVVPYANIPKRKYPKSK